MLFTSHITPHTKLGNDKCLKLLLGVCNTKEMGDLSISLVRIQTRENIESRSQYAPCTARNVRLREVIEPTLFLGRIRYLGDGVVHPMGVVDPGQVGLVQPLSQHLADECTLNITVSCRRHTYSTQIQ
jgi:hypothetical protein